MCKEFGWDYYTFESQPVWFIEEIKLVMTQVAQKQKADADKSKRSSKKPSMGRRR